MDYVGRVDVKTPKFSTDVRDKPYRRWSVKLCPEARFLGIDGSQLLFAVPNVRHKAVEHTKVFKFVTLREYGTMDLKGLEFVGPVRFRMTEGTQYFLFKEAD